MPSYFDEKVKEAKRAGAANPYAVARAIETRHLMKEALEGWKPSAEAAAAAREGLRLLFEGHGGRGLRDETVSWAMLIEKRTKIPHARLRVMAAWFARHAVDRRPGWSNPPTPGYVAWLLWGGEPAARHVTRAIYGRAFAV
ncbi:MAG: hypothetical protein ACHREM_04145 [Polyangiales bacterium]